MSSAAIFVWHFKFKYKQLCNDSTAWTENLLKDLKKQIKTMDEVHEVGKELRIYNGKDKIYICKISKNCFV